MNNSRKNRGNYIDPVEVPQTPDGPKMSAVVLKLAEPLIRDYGANLQRVEGIISITVAAWNRAMLPQNSQEEFEKEIIDILVPHDGEADSVATVVEMMEIVEARRKKYFPNIRKVIGHYAVEVSNGTLTVNVGTAPIPDEGNLES